jgi:hypothetical protein
MKQIINAVPHHLSVGELVVSTANFPEKRNASESLDVVMCGSGMASALTLSCIWRDSFQFMSSSGGVALPAELHIVVRQLWLDARLSLMQNEPPNMISGKRLAIYPSPSCQVSRLHPRSALSLSNPSSHACWYRCPYSRTCPVR